jgi:hypothetical protein
VEVVVTTRNDAAWAVRHCGYLTANDKHVFNTLLLSADNPDCNLPERFTPTRPELAAWTGLSASSVKRSVNHLVSHGWLMVETGRGNGRKSKYRLLPDAPDAECHCRKVSHRTLSVVPKEVTQTPLRVHGEPSKGSTDLANPQVEPQNPRKDARKEGVVALPCDKCDSTDTQITAGGYRLCRTHAGVQWKEPAA